MRHNCKALPQLDEECIKRLRAIEVDESLLDGLFDSISAIGAQLDQLPDTMQVCFPATEPPPDVLTRDFLIRHWQEIEGRSLLAQLSADRTLRDALHSFLIALGITNALSLVLSARAALENASAYFFLSRTFTGRKEKIEAEVLPFICGDHAATKSLYDERFVEDLRRFQHGARLWPIDTSPRTPEEWHAWRNESRYDANDPNVTASQLLNALRLNQTNVMTCLEKVADRAENMAALAMYDMLSEFCHPNCGNRSLGIASSIVEGETAIVDFVGTMSLTPGGIKAVTIGIFAMIEAIDIHIKAYKAIHESAQKLFSTILRRCGIPRR